MKKTFLLIISLITAAVLSAQVTNADLPYFDGFEDATSNAQWQKNVGTRGPLLTNKWYVSAAERYMGDSCMIISNNNGLSASYSAVMNTAMSYRDFLLTPGAYDISVTWRCLGDGTNATMYVCWVPSNQTSSFNSSVGGMPSGVNAFVRPLGLSGANNLSGSSKWQTAVTTLNVSGSGTTPVPYRLYLVWDNGTTAAVPPSACIDNIQIASRTCAAPSDITCQLTSNTATLSWTGSSVSYEVMYRAYGTTTFNTIKNVTTNQCQIPQLTEGIYDFFVRGICGTDTSIWVSKINVLVYLKDKHCIDFINLSKAVCTTGFYDTPDETVGIVPGSGPDDWEHARHTVHFEPGETDPFTGGGLPTVPPGGLASVRIGSSEAEDNGCETITYDYTIGANENIILMLDYAIVYEAPGHGEETDPKFLLEILDHQGNLINDNGLRCNEAYFFPPNPSGPLPDETWHRFSPPDALETTGEDIFWKEWTSMGINLSSLKGQKIKIRITIKDCRQEYHFAHAFFAINCAEAKLSGYACGETADFSATAPEGFNYRWYNPDNPNVTLGTDRNFSVPATQADTFMCDVIFKNKNNCYFTLPAYLLPRLPKANFVPEWSPVNCENFIKLDNIGGVLSEGRLLPGEVCEFTEWTVRDVATGAEQRYYDSGDLLLPMPAEGAQLDVRLVAGIGGKQCMDTMPFTRVVVPPVGAVDTTIRVTLCQGQQYRIGSEVYNRTGVYEHNMATVAGCDSNITLDLKIVDRLQSEYFDTICAGDTAYLPNGMACYKTNDYRSTMESSGGCDSVVTLHLTVLDSLRFNYTVTAEINGPGSGVIEIADTLAHWYRVVDGVKYGSLTGLKAGTYHVQYIDSVYDCRSAVVPIAVPRECLGVTIGAVPTDICADDELFVVPFTVDSGMALSYSLQFEDNAKAYFDNVTGASVDDNQVVIALKDSVRPDYYLVDVIFDDPICGPLIRHINFCVRYPATIMAQKWNDVIALYDVGYGGYDYISYQWYVDDTPIEGATGPYLYVGDMGATLSTTSEYSVMLTRLGDTAPIHSCYLTPTVRTDVSEYVTITQAQPAARIRVSLPSGSSDCLARWYTVAGQYLGEQLVDARHPVITAPATTGIYIVSLLLPDGVVNYKVAVSE